MKKNFAKLSALLAAVLFSSTSSVVLAQQAVLVEPVTLSDMQQRERVVGNIKAAVEAGVSVRESSSVEQVLVNEGDRVSLGDLLLRLDSRRLHAQSLQLQAEYDRSKALVKQRKAEQKNLQDDLTAFTYTAERNAISERQLRNVKTELAVAEAALSQANYQVKALQNELELLKIRLADTELRAPFNGYVTQRLAEPGEWFNQGEVAIEMVSSDRLEAWLEVPQRLVSQLAATSEIALEVNGQSISSKDFKLVSQVNNRSRTFNLVVSFPAMPNILSGMAVTGWVATSTEDQVLAVSKNAVVNKGGMTLVYKVSEGENGSVASPVPVTVLYKSADVFALAANSQLNPGDKVIVEGNERLMPGPVVATEAKTGREFVAANAPASTGTAAGGE
ncbi:efflux RND transporter periplasmic adaptor subunit [Thalassomonas viridans]|uniref:Efflux RND transporter periplasmic adaptor subunit n=1 Tax=Thalassomonas viridans TaxID=137584 RepID=A0AAE9Z627_9GAMM|nr:efflux RND transporter periplasmic adaptor subunit [Thalassomonas viridans]WDE05918.1 efflux RND transporter periplasmic adaptor subunit [Thalassomonas viridans]